MSSIRKIDKSATGAAEHQRSGAAPCFYSLRCLDAVTNDPLLVEIREEMAARSVLGVVSDWIEALRGHTDNDARPYVKLRRLFECGRTPASVSGHHDGVAIGLRSGDQGEAAAPFGNLLGLLWGRTVGPVAPWAGKSFVPQEDADGPLSLGINHFHRVEDSVMGELGFALVERWMQLTEAPLDERRAYGHQRNGGHFIARPAFSVWPGSPREVFQLNYRATALGNVPPFSFLIDELVEISEGLYLGQLLFSTRLWLESYDANLPPARYRYQHFGYFLLMDDRWAGEVRRVFHHLGPLGHQAAQARPRPKVPLGKKFSTLIADASDGRQDARLFEQVCRDLREHETPLDLLRAYSDELERAPDNRSAVFAKLGELFNRGVAPQAVHGYLRGARISFHAEGAYRLGSLNTLNMLWRTGRWLSPWTGKTFEPMSRERLIELTDGKERGELPTFWGANTLSFRTGRERLLRQAMRLLRVPIEEVTAAEQRLGYQAKSFFFIARQALSFIVKNEGKQVFQFNYRWPRLRTFPPDNYCVDELVMIAEGLYLGQLNYATALLRPFDATVSPRRYGYRVFGYFILMDEEWQRRRLAIGLDPYNL